MESKLSNILRSPWFVPTAVGVAAFGGGFTAGYILRGRKDLTIIVEPEPFKATLYDFNTNSANDEVVNHEEVQDDLPEGYGFEPPLAPGEGIRTDQPRNDPADIEVATDYDADLPTDPPPDTEETKEGEVVSIFATSSSDPWDYEAELRIRQANHIYVIHTDEFFNQETDFDQNTLTYYSGDDIMVDDKNTPVYGYERLIGELRFGHGSNDPNVFYVRNEDQKAEYEILFDPGSFATEVLGIYAEEATEADELKHSRNLLRFKME